MDLSWLDDLPPFDREQLSPQARQGLGAARYMRDFHGNDFGPAIRDFASSYNCDESTIRRWIHKARHELTQPERHCQDCGRPLPRGSRNSRRYCDTHANPAARLRRHRQRN